MEPAKEDRVPSSGPSNVSTSNGAIAAKDVVKKPPIISPFPLKKVIVTPEQFQMMFAPRLKIPQKNLIQTTSKNVKTLGQLRAKTPKNVRPFLCQTCKRSFCSASGLKNHERIHHQNAVEGVAVQNRGHANNNLQQKEQPSCSKNESSAQVNHTEVITVKQELLLEEDVVVSSSTPQIFHSFQIKQEPEESSHVEIKRSYLPSFSQSLPGPSKPKSTPVKVKQPKIKNRVKSSSNLVFIKFEERNLQKLEEPIKSDAEANYIINCVVTNYAENQQRTFTLVMKFDPKKIEQITDVTSERDKDQNDEIIVEDDANHVRCPLCNLAFGTLGSVRKHYLLVHRLPNEEESSENSKLDGCKCDICDKVFGSSFQLKTHRRVFHLPIRCEHCDFFTRISDRMRRHTLKCMNAVRAKNASIKPNVPKVVLKIKHEVVEDEPDYESDYDPPEIRKRSAPQRTPREKPMFSCKYCPLKAGKQIDLQLHMQRRHMEEMFRETQKASVSCAKPNGKDGENSVSLKEQPKKVEENFKAKDVTKKNKEISDATKNRDKSREVGKQVNNSSISHNLKEASTVQFTCKLCGFRSPLLPSVKEHYYNKHNRQNKTNVPAEKTK